MKWSHVLQETDTHWKRFFWAKEAYFGIRFNWTTDGCSMAPDSILGAIDLSDACAKHDFWYRNHPKLNQIEIPVTRWRADKCLFNDIRRAVKEALGFRGVIAATSYWLGVRLGGGGEWQRSSGISSQQS